MGSLVLPSVPLPWDLGSALCGLEMTVLSLFVDHSGKTGHIFLIDSALVDADFIFQTPEHFDFYDFCTSRTV